MIDIRPYLGKGWVPGLSVKLFKTDIMFTQYTPQRHVFNLTTEARTQFTTQYNKYIETHKVKSFTAGKYGVVYLFVSKENENLALTKEEFFTI